MLSSILKLILFIPICFFLVSCIQESKKTTEIEKVIEKDTLTFNELESIFPPNKDLSIKVSMEFPEIVPGKPFTLHLEYTGKNKIIKEKGEFTVAGEKTLKIKPLKKNSFQLVMSDTNANMVMFKVLLSAENIVFEDRRNKDIDGKEYSTYSDTLMLFLRAL